MTARVPAWQTCAVALLLTALQMLLALRLSGVSGLHAAYLSLAHFDSDWYLRIVNEGYHTDFPPIMNGAHGSNVAFFPAYPLLARWIGRAAHVGSKTGLLLAAQLSCVGFWTYLLLLLRRWKVPRGAAATGILLLLSYPSAFFLVAGYSESLFLCALLGFVYWCGRDGPEARALACMHGFVLTATRLVGLPLVLYPAMRTWLLPPSSRGQDNHAWRGFGVATGAAMGAAAFFLFCQIRFGHWDMYLISQAAGWGIRPEYAALFRPDTYLNGLPSMASTALFPGQLSRFLLSLIPWAGLTLVCADEWLTRATGDASWRERAPLYASAFLLWAIPAAAMAHFHTFESMSRHTLPSYVLLVLCGLHLFANHPPHRGFRLGLCALTAAAILLFLPLELGCIWLFMHGLWVA
jgi:hypothetical protein